MPKSQPKKAASTKPKASSVKAGKPAAQKPAERKPAPKTVAPAKLAAKTPAKTAVKKAPKSEEKPTKEKKLPKKVAVQEEPAAPVKTGKVAEKKETKADKKKPAVVDEDEEIFVVPRPKGPIVITPFQKSQREKLQALRDLMLDSMAGVAKDTLRSRPEGSEASAFGMHQADAGSDAYDKDFALSLLSQEQDALYEIEEAIKRIDAGTYGICEMSGKPIMIARLEALPFARYTVECQAELERTKRHQRSRVPVTSLFGLTDSEEEENESEDSEETPQKPQNEE
jgi:DnaK suppressor protein